MAGDDKASKSPAKEKAAPKDKAPQKEKDKAPQKEKAAVEAPAEAMAEPAAPSNYSRGEGQKPVSQAYKDNWNAIFAKKKKR